jgi:beta-glucosidase
VPAIISAFYPGQEQGHAIANILFGNVNPSGRLPVTIAQSAGHIPTVYDYKPSGRGYYHQPGSPEHPGRDYVFSSPDPLFAFGHGLSYTTFSYADLSIKTPEIDENGVVQMSFTLANTGRVRGKEVAQIYFRQLVSSVTTPVMRLIRFVKVELDPGEKKTIDVSFAASELKIWNIQMKHMLEPGKFSIMVGASAEEIKLRGEFVVGA